MSLPWHLYLMALLYVIAGFNHFRNPRLYLKILPPYFPKPNLLIFLSGLIEIILGICICFPFLSKFFSWGKIILLLAVFPCNIYMYIEDKASLGLSNLIRLVRLPFQFLLIYWAYIHLKSISNNQTLLL